MTERGSVELPDAEFANPGLPDEFPRHELLAIT